MIVFLRNDAMFMVVSKSFKLISLDSEKRTMRAAIR